MRDKIYLESHQIKEDVRPWPADHLNWVWVSSSVCPWVRGKEVGRLKPGDFQVLLWRSSQDIVKPGDWSPADLDAPANLESISLTLVSALLGEGRDEVNLGVISLESPVLDKHSLNYNKD